MRQILATAILGMTLAFTASAALAAQSAGDTQNGVQAQAVVSGPLSVVAGPGGDEYMPYSPVSTAGRTATRIR